MAKCILKIHDSFPNAPFDREHWRYSKILGKEYHHARCKYRYEKDGDAAVYLSYEVNYQEQLAELKERRKEAKAKLGTINRCLKESTYAHLEIPDDVDIENLYLVDVPEFQKKQYMIPCMNHMRKNRLPRQKLSVNYMRQEQKRKRNFLL